MSQTQPITLFHALAMRVYDNKGLQILYSLALNMCNISIFWFADAVSFIYKPQHFYFMTCFLGLLYSIVSIVL